MVFYTHKKLYKQLNSKFSIKPFNLIKTWVYLKL